MNCFRNIITGQVQELDPALFAAWQAAGNPKAQAWEPVDPPEQMAPPPSPPDYHQLWGSLLISEVFQVVHTQALESLPLAIGYIDFAAAMAAAMADAPNPAAIAAAARSILRKATLGDDHLAELRELFEAARLGAVADDALVPPASGTPEGTP